MYFRMPVDRLLVSHTIIDTSDQDDFAARMSELYDIESIRFLDTGRPFNAVVRRVRLTGLTLHMGCYNAPLAIGIAAIPGFRHPMVISGSIAIDLGRGGVALSDLNSSLVAPYTKYQSQYSGNYGGFLLQFDEDDLQDHLTKLDPDLRVHQALASGFAPAQTPQTDTLRLRTIALASMLTQPSHCQSPFRTELEDELKTAFVEQYIGSHPVKSTASERKAIYTIEEYLWENWMKPIRVEDIAGSLNVSTRSVFSYFKKKHGCSPMQHLRSIRLDHARSKLLAKEDGKSVIAIGLQCGFVSTGYFAQRYQERFGELPSTTMRRSGFKCATDDLPSVSRVTQG